MSTNGHAPRFVPAGIVARMPREKTRDPFTTIVVECSTCRARFSQRVWRHHKRYFRRCPVCAFKAHSSEVEP